MQAHNTNESREDAKKPFERLIKLREGQKVIDTWYEEWGVGLCVKSLKTRYYIKFDDGETRIYDKHHLQFLRKK